LVNFTVTVPGTPSFSSVAPNNGIQGATLNNVVILGASTHFGATTGVSVSGTNVAVTNVNVTSTTRLTCTIAIAAGAGTGPRNVIVATTASSETVTGTSVFTVNSGLPTITSIAPNVGPSPSTGITITGTNFTGVTAVTVGSTPTTYTYTSGTSITNVAIPSGLTVGSTYDVQVTNGIGQSAVVAGDKYTVTGASSGNGNFIYESGGGVMMAYPNPFNPLDKANPLKMLFNVPTGEAVDIYIFDTNGRVIYQDKNSQVGSNRTVNWFGDTGYGEIVENGLYLIRVVNNGKLVAKGKILVIKK